MKRLCVLLLVVIGAAIGAYAVVDRAAEFRAQETTEQKARQDTDAAVAAACRQITSFNPSICEGRK
jgi:uncharacterized protein HemX